MAKDLKILLFLLLVSTVSFAQNGKLFNTENGLSSSLATQVLQNHNGRIIIATRNGLNVYDGYNFKIINQNSPLGKGLSSNYFNYLCEDKEGRLFVATNTSVYSFDGRKFTHYNIVDGKNKHVRTYVNHLSLCHDGTILASTSGFGILAISPNKNATTCTRIKGGLNRYGYVLKTFEDSQRRLWVVGEDFRLICRLPNGKILTTIPGLETASVSCLCEDALGNLFIGTNHQGIFVIRRGNRVAERVTSVGTPENISCLTIVHGNILLIGCDGTGIVAYNIRNGWIMQNPFFSNLTNISHGKVQSIIEDKQGNIWIAMLQKGVYMHPSFAYDFYYQGPRLGSRNSIGDYCVNRVLLSHNGHIWVGTDMGGLYELDGKGMLLHHYYDDFPKVVMSLTEDDKGRIWVGTFNEGCGYISDGSYHPVDLLHGSRLTVFDIKVDRQGSIWFATMGRGLISCNKEGKITVYHAGKDAYSNQKINSIPNDFVSSIYFSKDGRHIFVGTSIGLACYDILRMSWTSTFGVNCIHKVNMINCLFEDSKGNIWFGCDNGLWKHDFINNKEIHFNNENSLPSNNISFITEDRLERLWIGTGNGLSCLNLKNGKVTNYFADNGLQSNEFSMRAVSVNANGNLILLGGTGGINWFNPLTVKQPKWKADVMITGVSSNDIYSLDDSKLVFAHDDNSFTLFFSTNTFNDVEQITYAYKLDNDKWSTLPQGSNDLQVTRLSAGTHKIQVKAIRNGQETPVKQYTIKVKAAWYATTWAKIAYFLLFCIFVWLIREDYRHKQHISKLIGQIKEIKKFVVPINKDVETQTPDDKLMERVMKYINDNLTDSDLSVEKIADAVGISRVHLHRKMKEITGQTPHALIKRLRLRQAAKLLEDPKQSISEVVYTCGFANSASFSTMFKAEYGVSPREYQRGKRKEED